jgi:hypothetical protein
MTPREQLIQEVLLTPEGVVDTWLKITAIRGETGRVEVAGRMGDRPIGLCKGEFVVPEDFDAPLPDNILSLFEQPFL